MFPVAVAVKAMIPSMDWYDAANFPNACKLFSKGVAPIYSIKIKSMMHNKMHGFT